MLAPLRSVGAGVACAGLRLADGGPRAAEKGMESAMAIERKELEARLSYLGTLGNNAPFVGLFGTVIGVILAFEALGDAGAVAGTGSSQMASGEVMGAIGCPGRARPRGWASTSRWSCCASWSAPTAAPRRSTRWPTRGTASARPPSAAPAPRASSPPVTAPGSPMPRPRRPSG